MDVKVQAAVAQGDVAVVESVVAAAPPAERAQLMSDLLCLAAAHGQPAVASALLRAGADPNGVAKRGNCPLGAAIRPHDPSTSMVELLLRAGADPNGRPAALGAPLDSAARSGHCGAIRCLLAAGASPSAVADHAVCPLAVACAHCATAEPVRLLLEAGADANAKSKPALALLRNVRSPPAALSLLCAHGLAPAAPECETLLLAAASHSLAMLRRLLDALPHAQPPPTALHTLLHSPIGLPSMQEMDADVPRREWLAELGAIIRTLVSHGAPVNARDSEGDTPLHCAARGYPVAILPLIECGADLEARNRGGFTPLHAAIAFDRLACAAVLVSAGADLVAKARDGLIPKEFVLFAQWDVMPRKQRIA